MQDELLFVSPTWPRRGSTGLAMRAWAVAAALGRRYRVSLVVPRSDGLPEPTSLPPNVEAAPAHWFTPFEERVRRYIHAQIPQVYWQLFQVPSDWPRSPLVPPDIAEKPFARIHVFRQFMAPFAEPFFGRIPCQLDMDESESRTRGQLAKLHRLNGNARLGALCAHEADFYEKTERLWLPRFDRVFVSSETERKSLEAGGLANEIRLLPNTVTIPPGARELPLASHSGPGEPFTFLFVGNQYYLPNADAMCFFRQCVLPLLRERAPKPFRIHVVGLGPRSKSTDASAPEIHSSGYLEDLGDAYSTAHAVIAPLRAGGGTRIKILEAFAHRCPVISTTIGAEGLTAGHDRHILIADSPEAFADACVRLMKEPNLPARLAANAFNLVTESYGTGALDSLL